MLLIYRLISDGLSISLLIKTWTLINVFFIHTIQDFERNFINNKLKITLKELFSVFEHSTLWTKINSSIKDCHSRDRIEVDIYLYNHCQSPLKLWVKILQGVLDSTLCYKVYQRFMVDQSFSHDSLILRQKKTDCHDIPLMLNIWDQ